MSGKQAKANRRSERLTEALLQAHSRLHDDDVDGCHDVLHRALGAGYAPEGRALATTVGFDEAFRRLAVEHQVRASFVLADPVTDTEVRLIAGGDAELCGFVRTALHTLQPPPADEGTPA